MLIIESNSHDPLFMACQSHLVWCSAELGKTVFQSDSEIQGGLVLPLTSSKTQASVWSFKCLGLFGNLKISLYQICR